MVVTLADHLVDGHLHRDRLGIVHLNRMVERAEQLWSFPGQRMALRAASAPLMRQNDFGLCIFTAAKIIPRNFSLNKCTTSVIKQLI